MTLNEARIQVKLALKAKRIPIGSLNKDEITALAREYMRLAKRVAPESLTLVRETGDDIT